MYIRNYFSSACWLKYVGIHRDYQVMNNEHVNVIGSSFRFPIKSNQVLPYLFVKLVNQVAYAKTALEMVMHSYHTAFDFTYSLQLYLQLN